MGLFKKKTENRASGEGSADFDDALLSALLGNSKITREMALQVPMVAGSIDLIAGIIAGTPIKLYKDEGGRALEVKNDPRLKLLNDETGDTLNAAEFWRAMTRDYYLGKGGYAYIRKEKGEFTGLFYVDESKISFLKNTDPIFKDFDILVEGQKYNSFDFLKILRNTRDGAEGTPITAENSKLIETMYETLRFEKSNVQKGGNKRGFLLSKRKLSTEAITALKTAFAQLYGNNSEEKVVILNDGIEFKESSATSVEMQLNESKNTNALEFARIFHISPEVVGGKASVSDTASLARLSAIPLMSSIQCALNKDFLLEKEKGLFYWAFDTKELLKGDMKERFESYKTALEANFMQIDEVRYAEDLEPLGMTWIKLGLNDVLYDPKTKVIYTPNTNQTEEIGKKDGHGLQGRMQPGTIEPRAGGNPYHDAKGRFASGGGAKVGKKEYARLCHQIATDFPRLEAGTKRYNYENRNHFYQFSVNDFGDYTFYAKTKIVGNEEKIKQKRREGIDP